MLGVASLLREAYSWIGPDHQERLRRIDQAFLGTMVEGGYLSAQPLVRHVFEKTPKKEESAAEEVGSFALGLPDGSGFVCIGLSREGMLKGVQAEEIPDAVAMRWLVLLHEVSHCAFAGIAHPFCPTPGGWPEEKVSLLNRWAFHPLVDGQREAKAVLNEAFSDAYAAMMLLEGLQHTPNAMGAVQNLLGIRASGEGANVYVASCQAIRSVLLHREEWRGMPPEVLQARALRYASDAFVVSRCPPEDRGTPASSGEAMSSLPPLSVFQACSRLLILSLDGRDPFSDWSSRFPDHPALGLLKVIWPSLYSSFHKSVPVSERSKAMEGIKNWDVSAHSNICQWTLAALNDLRAHSPASCVSLAFSSVEESLLHARASLESMVPQPSRPKMK